MEEEFYNELEAVLNISGKINKKEVLNIIKKKKFEKKNIIEWTKQKQNKLEPPLKSVQNPEPIKKADIYQKPQI